MQLPRPPIPPLPFPHPSPFPSPQSQGIQESIALLTIYTQKDGRLPSELEEVDETLWRYWNAATLCIVGCAWVVCVLQAK